MEHFHDGVQVADHPGNRWGSSPPLIDLTPDTGCHSRLRFAVMASHFFGGPLSRLQGLFRSVHNRAQSDCQVGPTIARNYGSDRAITMVMSSCCSPALNCWTASTAWSSGPTGR